MIIEFPEATPSNNTVIRMHHRDKSREHKRVTALMYYSIRQVRPPPIVKIKKCHAIITRHGARLLDWDNFGGGLKFVFDALVACGVIDDDNPEIVLSLQLRQRKAERAAEKTVIQLIPEVDL